LGSTSSNYSLFIKYYNQKSKIIFSNKYPIYFNHKLADIISTYTDVYQGLLSPSKISVITNCENYYLNNIGDIYIPQCPIPIYKNNYSNIYKNIFGISLKSNSKTNSINSLLLKSLSKSVSKSYKS